VSNNIASYILPCAWEEFNILYREYIRLKNKIRISMK